MNVQKIRDGLDIGLSAVLAAGYTRYQDNDAEAIREALAELEKPAEEDALEVARMWQIDCHHNSELLSGSEIAKRMEQYAESYLARKLDEAHASILAASDRLGAVVDEADKVRH